MEKLDKIADYCTELITPENGTMHFLSNLELSKSNITRMMAYLLVFENISPIRSNWPFELNNLYIKYDDMINTQLADKDKPLLDFSEYNARVIESDIRRGIHWFNNFASILKIENNFIFDVNLRVTRILTLISHNLTNFVYFQGHDRYIFIMYLLTLDCASKLGLDSDYAEAFAFYLAYDFIVLTNISHFFENIEETDQHFNKMEIEMEKSAPDIMRQITNDGHTSRDFALRWEILLFADEHEIKDLLLLWDQILLNRDEFSQYLFASCIAHIKQISPTTSNERAIEKIQNYKDWDINQIISDTRDYMTSYFLLRFSYLRRSKLKYTIIFLIIIIIVLLFNWY